jgi:diacylglycerol kinase family enzyme
MGGAAEAVPVLLNAGAGTSQTSGALLQERLGPGVRVETVPVEGFREGIRRVADAGAAVIGIAGGDGSMHAAAGVLAGTSITLLPVPTGTLNLFARRVGITSVEDAGSALRDGRVRILPVGMVGDRVFLNTLTFGEYSRIVRLRESYRRVLGKWPAAAVAFAIAFVSLRRFDVTLTVQEGAFTRRTPFVWVGVGWGSFPRVHEALERRSHPDLEVAVLQSDTALAGLGFLARLGAHMVRGRGPIRDSALEILHTRDLGLDSRHRIDATADGEVFRVVPPVTVSVRDDALRVLLGPGSDDGGE